MLPRLPFAGSHNLVCPPPRRRARPRQLPSLIRHRNSAGAARPSVARAPPRVCDGTMSCHLELRPGLLPLPLSPCLCHCPSSLCQATLSQTVVIFWKICAVCCSPCVRSVICGSYSGGGLTTTTMLMLPHSGGQKTESSGPAFSFYFVSLSRTRAIDRSCDHGRHKAPFTQRFDGPMMGRRG